MHFLQLTFIIHTIRLILYDQQAGEIDNLTVTLGQSFLVVLCAGVGPSPTGSITLVSVGGKITQYPQGQGKYDPVKSETRPARPAQRDPPGETRPAGPAKSETCQK